MSALTDLQDAVTQASTNLQALQKDVNAFITENSGGATDEQLEALTGSVGVLSTQIQQIDAIVNPPAPTSAPAPATPAS